jgi:thiamine pyrophosphokinase
MELPFHLKSSSVWTFVGPMGPSLPEKFVTHSLLGVDGGARFSPHLDIWVGDSDSYQEVVSCQHRFLFPSEKSQSDLALAYELFSEARPYQFHLWGCLGGRKDHELINFGTSLHFLKKHPGSEILFYDSKGQLSCRLVGKGLWQFDHQGTFSLLCLETVRASLSGDCKYPLIEKTPFAPLSSLGLSNYASGKVELNCEGPMQLIFSEDE